ncbi:hypothetical protein ACIQVU_19845 [Lysinibacillus sp. NPDC098008]|uniref:hypothetical protein n=1 Tax=Lysinibacillus sp. NPDC098008 TaxID=3364146 RepID=UPI00380329B9
MNFEIRILSNILNVKNVLKSISIFYQEDFLLEDIVFITIDDRSKLKSLQSHIEVTEEKFAYQL